MPTISYYAFSSVEVLSRTPEEKGREETGEKSSFISRGERGGGIKAASLVDSHFRVPRWGEREGGEGEVLPGG